MSDDPNNPVTKTDEHVKTFENLPEKEKDLHRLKESEERSSGKDRKKVDEEIEQKT